MGLEAHDLLEPGSKLPACRGRGRRLAPCPGGQVQPVLLHGQLVLQGLAMENVLVLAATGRAI